MSDIIQYIRGAALRNDSVELTDGQLLDDFLDRRDMAAFEVLVRRHGPMVWGVCRRILRGHHDAEDVFQATFLILVRKASSVVPREKLANWLYGVARHTALKARAAAARRQDRESPLPELPDRALGEDERRRELHALLDGELICLPEKYRLVVALCDLQGRTRKEAALELGVPEGTVAGQLARARSLLAKRFARRGLILSGAAIGALLAQEVGLARVPAELISTTSAAASAMAAGLAAAGVISVNVAALTRGVLKSMLMAKLRLVLGAGLAMSLLGGGICILNHSVVAAPRAFPPKAVEKEGEKAKSDVDLLQGKWVSKSLESGGKDLSKKKDKNWEITFDGEKVKGFSKSGGEVQFKLDSTKNPKEIDLVDDGIVTRRGIYELDADTLKVCWSDDASKRPTEFAGSQGVLAVFEKKKD